MPTIKKLYLNFIICLVTFLLLTPLLSSQDFNSNPEVLDFIKKMELEYNFDKEELTKLFNSGKYQEKVVRLMDRQPEGTMTWGEYKKRIVNKSRISEGKKFIQAYQQELKRAEDIYGVPVEVITAIIGIETRYGKNKGSTRVIDSLLTLSFEYPRRAKFFKTQLENFLLLAREENLDPYILKGSIAGAMGYGQFMPDSYRDYGVDFNFDGKRDLLNNVSDSIGSVANFLSKKGTWKPNNGIAVQASRVYDGPKIKSTFKPTLSISELKEKGIVPLVPMMANQKFLPIELITENGNEYWIGMHNYQAISRYNRSKLYIMAVVEFSNSLINSL